MLDQNQLQQSISQVKSANPQAPTTPGAKNTSLAELQAGPTQQPAPLSPAEQINENYRSGKINAGDVVVQDLGEAARQTNDALTSPFSPIGWVTGIIGGADKVLTGGVNAIDNFVAPKIGEALRKVVGADTADKIKGAVEKVNNSPLSQAIGKTYSSPQVTGDLNAVNNIATTAGTVTGAAGVAEALPDLLTKGSVTGNAIEGVSNLASKMKAPVPNATDVTGRITQATGSDIPVAQRGLSSIDTNGVKTFSDLSSKLNDQIKTNTNSVDTELGKNKATFNADATTKSIPVEDGAPVTSNPVQDSLDQLKSFYEKTNDNAQLAKIKNLETKFQAKGLTLKEMNGLAREHGQELNGYNANGELASGLSRQAAENTRTALKSTIRDLNPNDTTGGTDKNTSDLIKTKDLVDEMDMKVQQLENKLKSYGTLQKLGRFAGKAFDMMTGGIAKGFLKSIMGIGGEQGTTMNALQLQDTLSKNLKLLDKLNSMSAADSLNEIGKMVSSVPPTTK